MNFALRQAALLGPVLFLFCPPVAHVGGKSAVDDCVAVGRGVNAAVTKTPANLLPIVQKALTANEDCACEIVRAAILSVESEPDLVREIVITALETAETRAAEIAECAVLAAPEAVEAVKSALHSVLGTGGLPKVGSPISVHGIFLVPPETASPTNPAP